MRRPGLGDHRTGFGVFLLGTGMGLITNLITGDPDHWPAALRGQQVWAAGISASETSWMATMAESLAAAERSAVVTEANLNNIPATFMDARPYFTGLGACGTPRPAIHDLVYTYTPGEAPEMAVPDNPYWRIGISQQSFHPNPDGTSYFAQAAITALRRPEVDQ
jgi:hypothetical protein